MTIDPYDRRPVLDGAAEFNNSKYNRDEATELAYNTAIRPALSIRANPEEQIHQLHPIGNFSKGMPHNIDGNVGPKAYEMLVKALRKPNNLEESSGFPAPLGPDPSTHPVTYTMADDYVPDGEAPVDCYFHVPAGGASMKTRKWESPLGGLNSDITGPCIGGVSLPPAPALGSSELAAEMAEVYAMALMRDISFSDMQNPRCIVYKGDGITLTIGDLVKELGSLPWFDPNGTPHSSELTAEGGFESKLTDQEQRRRAARWDEHGTFSVASLFRGSTVGAKTGPYLSQFMLQGDHKAPSAGMIPFGTQAIDQRHQPDNANQDFMVRWFEWLDVQNGAKTPDPERNEPRRFLTTLRDLAAYVHVDQLYQAYFNAALLLLSSKKGPEEQPFDFGLPNSYSACDTTATREGFATWGGPHLLDLMASVSSRGLKIIRRQKFQIHRRARPEVLAARLAMESSGKGDALGSARDHITAMLAELREHCPTIIKAIAAKNAAAGGPGTRNLEVVGELPVSPITEDQNLLLPMAFSEGSPMHPAYGAGHATVAGACVTVLKALLHSVDKDGRKTLMKDFGFGEVFESKFNGATADLEQVRDADDLKLSDELDKLAANISIGRNMAGVHYFTDYFESLRLGERVAVGILQEHLQTSPEDISVRLYDFDGRLVEIRKMGGASHGAEAEIIVMDDGTHIPTADWWTENVREYEMARPYLVASAGKAVLAGE